MNHDAIEPPDPRRLDPNRHDYEVIVAAHRQAVAAGQSLYRDPTTGLWCFTSAALLERGWCCERQCRHCPYLDRSDTRSR